MTIFDILLNLFNILKKAEKYLIEKGSSFRSASLFGAIQAMTNLKAPCSPDFQEILDISTKLTTITELIEISKTILDKHKLNDELNPNEKTFLEYVSMVSQISEMTLELLNMEKSISKNVSDYNNAMTNLERCINNRFDAFVKFMDYLYYHQRLTPDKRCNGSPSKQFRVRTDNDELEIKKKEIEKQNEIELLSDESKKILDQKKPLLERLSQLSNLVLDITKPYDLISFPEYYIFLLSFDTDYCNMFRSKFMIINEIFQSLKTEINDFIQEAISLTEKCWNEYSNPEKNTYLANWNNCTNKGIKFLGKQD